MFLKSLERSERFNIEAVSAEQYGNLGRVYSAQEKVNESFRAHRQALHFYKQIGDEIGIANEYCGLAIVYTQVGDFASALEYYDNGLKICERIGNHQKTAACYFSLGETYNSIGQCEAARSHYEKSKALCCPSPQGSRDHPQLIRGVLNALQASGGFLKNVRY